MSECNLREIFHDSSLTLDKITLKKGVRIVNTNKGRYVIKKKPTEKIDDTYKYLSSRAFNYFPRKVENDEYDIFDYIEDYPEPKEQKIEDLIYLISLLHSKTTFYKEVDIDTYKEIYESVWQSINQSIDYYQNLINEINKEVYMSPSSYLLARNISLVFYCLDTAKQNIESWYEIVKDKNKIRYVQIHNNLSLEHYIKNKEPYLISWNKSKIDLPIYDLIKLYKNHYEEFDFYDLFHTYESKYPLMKEEKLLMFSILLTAPILKVNMEEYTKCERFGRLIYYLSKTENLASKYREKQKP